MQLNNKYINTKKKAHIVQKIMYANFIIQYANSNEKSF